MSAEDPTLRQRKPLPATAGLPSEQEVDTKKKTKRRVEDDDEISEGISFVDILRVISGLLVLSCLFSWFITDGESLTWGYRPRLSRWRILKAAFKPTIELTDIQLARYNGEDPSLPIYVAVNGSVFDVSANPSMYGPGGGYSFFAGRDAARAFVSGCFKEDLTWDLRGLERMYITGENKEEDDKEAAEIAAMEAKERAGTLMDGLGMHEQAKVMGRLKWLRGRRERRAKEAWEKVEKQVKHWDSFFRNHEKYFYVGKVVHPSLEGTPIRELCEKQKKPSKKRRS